jgi:hypothetical protein
VTTRRQFLKVGLVGGGVLVAAGWFAFRPKGPQSPAGTLDERTATIVAALVPVVLAGVLPVAAEARRTAIRETVDAFGRAVSGLAPGVQEEIAQLFSLLGLPPTRVALAGVWTTWDDASPADIIQFLDRWRTSRFDLLRAGYQALTRLLQASWYGNPSSWAHLGYPGPPSLGSMQS